MYQDKFGAECKRVKKEIKGTYTFHRVPFLEIVDLEKVLKARRSDVRGASSSMRGPSLMDLDQEKGQLLMHSKCGSDYKRTKSSTYSNRDYQSNNHSDKTCVVISTLQSQAC